MDFNDRTMTTSSLDDIKTTVDRLLTDSVEVHPKSDARPYMTFKLAVSDTHILCIQLLNQVNSGVLAALLDEYGATVDSLDQLLESHIMNSTYDIVFFKITIQLKQQDWDFAEAIRELRVRNQFGLRFALTFQENDSRWSGSEQKD